jgi:hypothetical protein
MAEALTEERHEGWPERLRRAALLALFALVLLIPKTLGLRRRPRVWNALRTAVALAGAALVVVPMALASSPMAAVIGLALFLLALLATPEKQEQSVDARARELGALVVVNGGRLHVPGGEPMAARLFVAPEHVCVFDPELQPLLEIPFAHVASVRAEEAPPGWKLRVEWVDSVAEFFYDGFFAEHLARVAERTLLSQIHRELPVLD